MWKRIRERLWGRKHGGKSSHNDDASATHPSMPIPAVTLDPDIPPGPDLNNTRPVDLAALGLATVPSQATSPAVPEPPIVADPAEIAEIATLADPIPPATSVLRPTPAIPEMPVLPAAPEAVAPDSGVSNEEKPGETEVDEGGEEDQEDGEEEDGEKNEDEEGGTLDRARSRARTPFLGDRVAFGGDLWGISARHRGAEADEARLARFGLPVLLHEAELASWLGIGLSRLRWYTFDRPADTTWHYVRYVIPKRHGGERVILAPKRELKALQRKVLDGIVARVPVSEAVHGFVAGRSIVTNAWQHTGKRVLLKLDLKDFFPSITFPRVRGLFIALGYSFGVASTLALLCTEYEREPFERDGTRYYISTGPRHLVQGAPTSPALANLAAWRLDQRMSGLAAKHGYVYTRYADDLVLSSDLDDEIQHVRQVAQRIVQAEHFTVNKDKTRIARRAARQVVTGLVVNDGVATPRELRRRLRAILHNAGKNNLEAQNRESRRDFRAYLQGQIAHVHAANANHAARLRSELRRVSAGEP